MQIKKFIGENASQAMALVKKEMGNEAIILQTKKIKSNGFLGFFKKDMVEVLAALETDKTIINKQKNKKNTREIKSNSISLDVIDNLALMNENGGNISKNNVSFKEVNKIYQKHNITSKNDIINDNQFNNNIIIKDNENKNEIVKNNDIVKDIDEIKNVIKNLNDRFIQKFHTNEDEEILKRTNHIIDRLVSKGISNKTSKEIAIISNNNSTVFNKEVFIDSINIKFSNYEEKIAIPIKKHNIFIGPTGVGKTTTLAKIASSIALSENRRIGFLTLDTYRISAVEQLKTYAEILNCPIEVAYDKDDISEAMNRLEKRDMIFIDTAGRSHKNKEQMLELKEMINCIDNKTVYLVISANFNIDDIKDIIESYNFIDDFNIIITKLDETSREGIVFDVILESSRPISHTTYGQNVPDDIEIFDFKKFINEFSREI